MKKRPEAHGGVLESAGIVPATISSRDKFDPFPVAGIGASAGGLEALSLFLKHVPKGSGIAFVIIQHLDPTHKGMLVKLLQRATIMPVAQVRDHMKVAPDHVYVIPPNRDMSIVHGILHLLAPVAPRGLHLPIDSFFRSLADDRRDQAIGVLLSGMGSDGTLGLRAIKEKGGVVFVQSLTSAKFSGMPKSAIDAGLAGVVAPAEELPGRITAYLKHAPFVDKPDAGIPIPSIQEQADLLLLQHYSPAAVLASDSGDILYISGHTGKYLEPAAGKANWNILAMAREGLRYDLTSSFRKAIQQKSEVILKGAQVPTEGGVQTLNVTVRPLAEPPVLRGMVMIVFTDVATHPEAQLAGRIAPAGAARIAELERDLQQVRQELQTTREEMQSSREELKSANEEMQSTNEELQSTNEELTTSKEEMQSMNEELQTVNSEMQASVDELTRTGNDMKNLLDSTGIATLFLDNQLNVRRFTPKIIGLIKLIAGDVGRPISDIATDMDYPDLTADVREVLRTLVFKEKPVKTGDGRWFLVRIMPYRTYESVIDGAVITFMDITISKTLEAQLRQARADLENRIATQTMEMDKAKDMLQEKNKGSQQSRRSRKMPDPAKHRKVRHE